MTITPSDRSFLTYAEYKLFCHKNNKKPLNKNKTGIFINKSDLNYLFDDKNSNFDNNDIRDFAEMLFIDGKLSLEKIKEISVKIGFDETKLLSIFNNYENFTIDEEQFKKFLNNI